VTARRDPRRRDALAAGAAVALTAASARAQPSSAPRRRASDIIVILADDLGWSDLGCYGSEIRTPHLDRLAAGGSRFTRFYNTAKCYTTRAAVLTGLYQHEAGIGGLISRPDRPVTPGPYQGFLDLATPTLAEMLKRSGHRSLHCGKWHVGERREHWPMKRGFDASFGLISGATSYWEVLPEAGRERVMVLNDQPWTPPDGGWYATDAYSGHACAMIEDHARDHADKPLFLYLAYTAPHWPLHAPEPLIAANLPTYETGWDAIREERDARARALGLIRPDAPRPSRPADIPAWEAIVDAGARADWVRRMATHAAMIEAMDAGVGRVLATLDRHGRADDALVLFLSDNGASHEDVAERGLHRDGSTIGAKGSFASIKAPWAWACNAPFRGSKEAVLEGGINTPCILSWPKGRAGKPPPLVTAPCHVVDIVPTALSLAGLGPPASGKRLRGLPLSAAARASARAPLFFEIFGERALIDGRWKALRAKRDAAWSLFDLRTDPSETIDLAARHPARLARMTRRWRAMAAEVGVRERDRT
jgi:arylsulfatase